MVHAVLQHTLPDTYWLAAEVGEMRVASNGHCYLEFVQKDEVGGTLLAKARGHIWRQGYVNISAQFRRATGQDLRAGLKVLAEVEVNFHELYGYSLHVVDIDPTYTLGDLAAHRQAIIRQLEADGVINLNKEIPLPRLIRRVAVISSATAAGYGDFCRQLEQSGYGFEMQLFPAVMQGDGVEQSVIAALDRIAAESGRWDVAVIIRGGGSSLDLHGFDTYLLAANVAQFPLPVLSGIGHERDDTLVDLVAHTRLKTPTAVAAFLVQLREDEAARLYQLAQRLQQAVAAQLEGHGKQLTALGHRLQLAATQYVHWQQQRLLRHQTRLDVGAQIVFQNERHRLELFRQRAAQAVKERIGQERHRLEMLDHNLQLASPERILRMGYTLTTKDGKVVQSAGQLAPGVRIVTHFADGERQSVVQPFKNE